MTTSGSLLAEHVGIVGAGGDWITAYEARPLRTVAPGVILIHHAPGLDEFCQEATRKLAHHGFAAVAPYLYSREGLGDPDDIAARVRTAGGVPDEQAIGDLAAAVAYVRAQPYTNGRVGMMGFCSGGRQTFLAACSLSSIDAAVDCWGGAVIVDDPSELGERRPVAPIDLAANLSPPLLGLFGNDDTNPSPDHVNRTEAVLKRHDKTYEFHRYDGAGHGFFAIDRPGYRPEQATDGWQRIFDFFNRYLSSSDALE